MFTEVLYLINIISKGEKKEESYYSISKLTIKSL